MNPSAREWDKGMKELATEGICNSQGSVPEDLVNSFRECVARLTSAQNPPDFHPNSNNMVRDLVHPALYPFIKGKSWVHETHANHMENYSRNKDYFNRKYEDSVYQWMPSEVYVNADGQCKFKSYVNNLGHRKKEPAMYDNLERLMTIILPRWESIMGYTKNLRLMNAEEGNEDLYDEFYDSATQLREQFKAVNLRNATLR